MLIKKVPNPRIPLQKENIVGITMTLDQFHNLRDCVSLAYQNADRNSRMFLIAEMIYKDFQNLTNDLNREEKTEQR